VIGLAAAGGVFAERRRPGRAAELARSALVASLYTLIPFAVFFNIARLELTTDVGLGIVLGWVALASAGLLAWLIGDRLLRLSRPATGALIVCTLVPNSGYLGYPLAASLLGFGALGEAVAYDILVAAPSLLLGAFAVGAAFGTAVGERPRDRVIAFLTRNPPLYAALAGALVPDGVAPDALLDASRVAVVALLPLGFFAVGAILAEEARIGELPLSLRIGSPIASAVVLRMVIAPGLLALLALPLIELPGPYLLLAATPCGINTLVVAHVYGLEARLTAEAIAWSTAIAVLAALVAAPLA
jgi:malate permease and related proteins